jgi:filamentous hemagglutinin family protein
MSLEIIIKRALCFSFPLFFLSIPAIAFGAARSAIAQDAPITADGTTGTQINTNDGSNFDINGGDKAGGNLFHSFGNFSVPNGGAANFLNSPDVVNIINRVTGGKISDIQGLISAQGSANLFLINPAGIVFGANASLNIGGSFLGSTADSLVFPEGEFSAVNAEGKPLLTINAPIGLNIRDNPAPIVNQSKASESAGIPNGLEVEPGKSLSLIGGDVLLEGGNLTAPAGIINLGGLSAAGQVRFNENGSLSFPNEIARGNVSLSNGAFVNVTGTRGGDINVTAANIQMTGNSILRGGTFADVGLPDSQSGDINLNATGAIDVDGSSIENFVEIGNAGNININSKSLNLTNSSQIASSTFGIGNAGNVTIATDEEVKLSGARTIISSNVESGAVGDGGKTDITAKSLTLEGGAQLRTIVEGFDSETNTPGGKGNAGTINVNAADTVNITGRSQQGRPSGLRINILEGGEGKVGDLNVKTRNLSLADDAAISSSTFGKGDAGNITVNATDNVSLDTGDIFSNIEAGAEGNGGEVKIETGSLNLKSGGQIQTLVRQAKNNLPAGKGDAGNVIINARDAVTLDGLSSDGEFPSKITSEVETGAVGKAGNIEITTGNLSLTNGAQLISSSFGQGDAGNIIINARDTVTLDGTSSDNEVSSAILSRLGTGAVGKAGNIEITTGNLSLTNGAALSSSTSGQGDAGNIIINARDTVTLDGISSDGEVSGAIFSTVERGAVGNGGEIKIETVSLNLKGGGQIQTIVRQADPENNLPAGKGDAGNIIINARDAVTLDGNPSDGEFSSAIFSSLDTGAEGKAGNIEITTGNLSLTNGGVISSSIFGKGDGGDITINFKDTLKLRGGGLISARADGEANAGNININSPDGFIVAFPGGNNILATATQQQGGNISIDVNKVYGFDKKNIQSIKDTQTLLTNGENDINSTSGKPQLSGNINLNTDILDPAKERAKTNEQAIEPDITVAQACDSGDIAKANTFTITGRGGMPEDPTKPLNSVAIAGNLKSGRDPMNKGEGAEEQRSEGAEEKKTLSSDEIIPARGVAYNEKGQVVLTRYPTKYGSDRPLVQSDYCSTSLQQEELSATEIQNIETEETLSDRTVEELMNFLYSQKLK